MTDKPYGWEHPDIPGYFWNGEAMQMKLGVPLENQPNIPSLESIKGQMETPNHYFFEDYTPTQDNLEK